MPVNLRVGMDLPTSHSVTVTTSEQTLIEMDLDQLGLKSLTMASSTLDLRLEATSFHKPRSSRKEDLVQVKCSLSISSQASSCITGISRRRLPLNNLMVNGSRSTEF